jgi:hypothetical protein
MRYEHVSACTSSRSFQADKQILAEAMDDYRDAGGRKKDLLRPKLPKS